MNRSQDFSTKQSRLTRLIQHGHSAIHFRIASRKQHAKQQLGMVAIEFVAGLGFLLLPVTLLVMSFPNWADRQSLARVTAREVARSYALTADQQQASLLAAQIAANYGAEPGDVQVTFDPYPTAPIKPGDVAEVHVSVKVPAFTVGGLELSAASFDYKTSHGEPIDVFRSRKQ